MQTVSTQFPRPGHYRLAPGVRIVAQADSDVALCAYPLRLVRLSPIVSGILSCCGQEEQTCEQLAEAMNLPLKRIEALCTQLAWKSLLEAGPHLSPAHWPPVSIVIPTYNRAVLLERCLRSLLALDYPCLEIIVVNDASTDRTGEMLADIEESITAQRRDISVIHHERREGAGIARNTGAEAARYELIAYIDDDCVASADWLKELVPVFQDPHLGAVGGMIRANECRSLLGRYEDVRSSLYMGARPQQVSLTDHLTYLPTANFVVRRASWEQIGGFEPLTHGEDVDFCRRLLATGAAIEYAPRGVVYHAYRTSMWGFFRTRVDYASSEAVLWQRFPDERRTLLLPPEQATFAGATLGAGWSLLQSSRPLKGPAKARPTRPYALISLCCCLFLVFILTLFGARTRLQKVHAQRFLISPLTILKATVRTYLAYTYHLCRYLTRYYTLPLLTVSLLIPPLLLPTFLLCGVVLGTDYVRLRPAMGLGAYALCTLFDDCAYEIGIVWGCLKQGTWQPLLPRVKKKIS